MQVPLFAKIVERLVVCFAVFKVRRLNVKKQHKKKKKEKIYGITV